MAKRRRSRKRKQKQSWYDFGNEVMDGAHNVASGLWKEATCHPDSYNQRAMDALAGTAAFGLAAATVAGRAGSSAVGAVYDTIDGGIQAYHDRIWDGERHKGAFK